MIRRATQDDIASIFEVHCSAVRGVTGYYSASEIDVWSGRKSSDALARVIATKLVLIDEHEGKVRGFGQLDLDHSVIEAVYVAPQYWLLGIGSDLLSAIEAAATEAGKDDLTLDASLNSVGFYEAAGYKRTADSLHELCAGTSIACFTMRKTLKHAA